jgi:hypothetical protein
MTLRHSLPREGDILPLVIRGGLAPPSMAAIRALRLVLAMAPDGGVMNPSADSIDVWTILIL